MTLQTKLEMLRAGGAIALWGYLAYCIAQGQIKRGTFINPYPPLLRSERPLLFWCGIGIIAITALAVMFAPQAAIAPVL